ADPPPPPPPPRVPPPHPRRAPPGVVPHPPLAIVGGPLGPLPPIDPEVGRATAAEVTAVALVAHQRLVAPAQLLPQGRHDRPPVGGVLASCVFVEADDVPAVVDPGLLDLPRRRVVALDPGPVGPPLAGRPGEGLHPPPPPRPP